MRVRWLRLALQDLNDAAKFISTDSPQAAARFAEAVFPSVERLTEYPAAGRPGRVPGTRELIVPGTRYIVPYRVRGEVVEVLRVLHPARRWPERL